MRQLGPGKLSSKLLLLQLSLTIFLSFFFPAFLFLPALDSPFFFVFGLSPSSLLLFLLFSEFSAFSLDSPFFD